MRSPTPKDPKSLARTARGFHALADETRLRITERLRDGEQCVCDLTDALDAGQSLLSFHLKTLRDAGLVSGRRQGRWVYYSLNLAALEELEARIGSLKPSRPGLRASARRCD